MTSTAAFGRLASYAGFSPQWFSQLSIAANIATNAPKEATQQALYGIQQDIEQLALGRGGLTERLKSLSLLGIDIQTGTPEERMRRIIEELPKALQRFTLPQAQAFLQGSGLPPEFIQFMKMGPGAVAHFMEQAAPIAITEHQTEAMQRLQTAFNGVYNAYEGLVRSIETSMAPTWVPLLNMVSKLTTELQQQPEVIKRISDALELLVGVITIGLLGKLARVFPVLSAMVGLLGVLESFTSHGSSQFFPEEKTDDQLKEERSRKAERFRKWQEEGAKLPWWQRIWRNLGGMPEDEQHTPHGAVFPVEGGGRNNPGNIRVPGSTGTGSKAFQSFSTPEAGITAIKSNLLSYQEQHGLNTVSGIISRWSPPNENATSTLIANASRRMGVGPNDPIDLHDSATMQKMVNAISMQEVGRNVIPTLDTNLSSAGINIVKSAQAGMTNSSSVNTTNNHDNDFNIHVATQPGADHYQIGGAVADAIKRSMLTSNANVGLE